MTFQKCCFTNPYSVHIHSSLKVVNNSCIFPKQGYDDTAINIYLKWCYVVQIDVFHDFKKLLLFFLICILWIQNVLQNLKIITLILQCIFFMHYISVRKTSSRIFFMRFNEKKRKWKYWENVHFHVSWVHLFLLHLSEGEPCHKKRIGSWYRKRSWSVSSWSEGRLINKATGTLFRLTVRIWD